MVLLGNKENGCFVDVQQLKARCGFGCCGSGSARLCENAFERIVDRVEGQNSDAAFRQSNGVKTACAQSHKGLELAR